MSVVIIIRSPGNIGQARSPDYEVIDRGTQGTKTIKQVTTGRDHRHGALREEVKLFGIFLYDYTKGVKPGHHGDLGNCSRLSTIREQRQTRSRDKEVTARGTQGARSVKHGHQVEVIRKVVKVVDGYYSTIREQRQTRSRDKKVTARGIQGTKSVKQGHQIEVNREVVNVVGGHYMVNREQEQSKKVPR